MFVFFFADIFNPNPRFAPAVLGYTISSLPVEHYLSYLDFLPLYAVIALLYSIFLAMRFSVASINWV